MIPPASKARTALTCELPVLISASNRRGLSSRVGSFAIRARTALTCGLPVLISADASKTENVISVAAGAAAVVVGTTGVTTLVPIEVRGRAVVTCLAILLGRIGDMKADGNPIDRRGLERAFSMGKEGNIESV